MELNPFDDITPPEQAFSSVDIMLDTSLRTVVSWKLKQAMPAEDGLFCVERSVYGEPFRPVTGMLDDCSAVIEGMPVPSPDKDSIQWRVVYIAGGRRWESIPLRVASTIDKRDRGLLDVIAHREAVTIERYSGAKGLLLKSRTSGRPCPICFDKGIESATRTSCPNCFGTGHAGGFYHGKPWTVNILGEPDTSKDTHPVLGAVEKNNKVTARAMHLYPAEPGDIWIDSNSQERWVIGDVQPEISFRGVVLTVKMSMSRLQRSAAHPINEPEVSEELQKPLTEEEKWAQL